MVMRVVRSTTTLVGCSDGCARGVMAGEREGDEEGWVGDGMEGMKLGPYRRPSNNEIDVLVWSWWMVQINCQIQDKQDQ